MRVDKAELYTQLEKSDRNNENNTDCNKTT